MWFFLFHDHDAKVRVYGVSQLAVQLKRRKLVAVPASKISMQRKGAGEP